MQTIKCGAIQKLIESGESETLEFKTRLPSDHVIAMVLSAFANANGVLLLIGVNDDGTIKGLSKADCDLVISDMARDVCPTTGIDFFVKLR